MGGGGPAGLLGQDAARRGVGEETAATRGFGEEARLQEEAFKSLSSPGCLGLHSGVLMNNLSSLWGFWFYTLHRALGIFLTSLGGAGITGKKRLFFSSPVKN